MTSDRRFAFNAIMGSIAALVVITAGVAIPVFHSDRNECSYLSTNAGAQTKFVKNHLLSWDCFVMVDGKWIPESKWRGDEE